MNAPLTITMRNVPRSDALDAHIRHNANRIEALYPRRSACHLVVEIPHRHSRQGNLFNVRLEIKVPGKLIVLNRNLREDVYAAVRHVFDAACRRLEAEGRRQPGAVTALVGTIARLFPDERFGFIETADGEEYYFSAANVLAPAFDRLEEGENVHFVADSSADSPQAKRVSASRKRGPDSSP